MSLENAIITYPPKGGIQYKKVELIEPKNYEVKLIPSYIGICGTDRGIVSGSLPFASNPPGSDFLVLGHEALLKVVDVIDNDYIKKGDMVVPLVRRFGNCVNCRIGRRDNCCGGESEKRNAGIVGESGFMHDIILDDIKNLIKVEDRSIGKIAVLTEPLKNVMKAFEIFDVISKRSIFFNDDSTILGKKMVVIGTGSEAFLFSFAGVEKGFDVMMVNRHNETEDKLKIMSDFGILFSNYLEVMPEGIDLLIDTSGDPQTVFRFIKKVKNNGIVMLFGTNGRAPGYSVDGETINQIVEGNITIAGSVDGAKIHYLQAIKYLSNWKRAHQKAMSSIITYEAKPSETNLFFQKPKGEIKTVIKWL